MCMAWAIASERANSAWLAGVSGNRLKKLAESLSLTQAFGTLNVKPGLNDFVVWLPAGRMPGPEGASLVVYHAGSTAPDDGAGDGEAVGDGAAVGDGVAVGWPPTPPTPGCLGKRL